MTLRQQVLRHITPGMRGIEVAPWFNPIVPPNRAYEVVVLDIFDRPTLLERAELDPNIDKAMIPRIGKVDLVGSACEIGQLALERFGPDARFDFVISSHNLEHLPDPVRFLRGCEALLGDGGNVLMLVPDKRACFDYFRPHSSTGDMLQAFHERRERPSAAQTFSQIAYQAALRLADTETGAFSIDVDPNDVALRGDLKIAYAHWLGRIDTDIVYHDTHCWTFTPACLELILVELTLLGLINFDVVSISRPVGCEFLVHLRKRPAQAAMADGLAGRRELLLKRIAVELASNSPRAREARPAGIFDRHALRTAILTKMDRISLLPGRIRGRIRRRYGV